MKQSDVCTSLPGNSKEDSTRYWPARHILEFLAIMSFNSTSNSSKIEIIDLIVMGEREHRFGYKDISRKRGSDCILKNFSV